jgi:hypothetical protein
MSLPPDDLGDDDDRPPIPWGDYGTIILAAIFSLTGLYLIFAPSPFANIKLPKAPPAAQSQPAQTSPSQEVTIGIGGGSAIHPRPIKPQ